MVERSKPYQYGFIDGCLQVGRSHCPYELWADIEEYMRGYDEGSEKYFHDYELLAKMRD